MFRDEFPTCPTCAGALDDDGPRLRCPACHGVLVPASHVEEMLQRMTPDDQRGLDARLADRVADASRRCPCCSEILRPVSIETIPADRCPEHGLWFDENRLAWTLENAGRGYADRHAPLGQRNLVDDRLTEPARVGIPKPPPRG